MQTTTQKRRGATGNRPQYNTSAHCKQSGSFNKASLPHPSDYFAQQGLFTHPVQIGLRAVGWPSSEVAALNAARIAGKSDEEIRALVVRLEAARKLAS
jgi:hypothetical protein